MDTQQNQEVGFVTTVRDFLVYLDGLPSVKIYDLVVSEEGARGWVNSILEDKVEVLIVDDVIVKPGQCFKRLEQKLSVAVGEFLLGRALNPLAIPIDGKGLLAKSNLARTSSLDKIAPGIPHRQFINRQFITGISIVDSLIPIGCGQRELVMGDPRSGRNDFLADLIVNQKGRGVICVYTSIGKTIIEVRNLIDTLRANDALAYTVVIAAASSDPAPLIFLAPQTALTVAEYFQSQGKDVLVVLDDLGTHAKIYREMALLSGKSPGRESFPGDIFYQHAHLLERAGNFSSLIGGGSITAIPVIELDLNDFTSFIPTNLMSMTDGHLLFRSNLYNMGQRPAIDLSLSVSRIGQQTQNRVQNLLATKIKQTLAQAADLETVSRFATELPQSTQLVLKTHQMLQELLIQEPFFPIPPKLQSSLLALPFTSFLKNKDLNFVKNNKPSLINSFSTNKNLNALLKMAFNLKDEEELINNLEKLTPELDQLFKQKT